MPRRECPDCERSFTGQHCPGCGWRPDRGSGSSELTRGTSRCAWVGWGKQCQLQATVFPSPGGTQGRCSWHDFAERFTEGRQGDFAVFHAWTLELWKARYCALWTHADAEVLWRATRGELPSGTPVDLHPCKQEGCIVSALEDKEKAAEGARRWLSDEDGRAAAAIVKDILEKRLSPAEGKHRMAVLLEGSGWVPPEREAEVEVIEPVGAR